MNRIGLCFFFLLLAGLNGAAAAEKPNVLFISVDDLNDWVGFLKGHPQVKTPHMDRLVARGTVFTNAHCAAPVCGPSRAAVFSGKYPHETGVYSNEHSIQKSHPDLVLLPEHFRAGGYSVRGAGKLMHRVHKGLFDQLYKPEQRWSPFAKGSVRYQEDELRSKGTAFPRHVVADGPGGREYVLPLNRMPSDRAPNETKGESFDWGAFDLPDRAFGDGLITDWAIEQLKERREKPLFLAVGYYRPHIPLYAPKRFFDLYPLESVLLPEIQKDDLEDVGPAARKWAREAVTAGSHATVVRYGEWKKAVQAYLACVSFIDAQIGRLLDALDASDESGNTVIMLWSDHGWHLGEKEHWGKWTGWERSTRVPLVVVAPEHHGPSGKPGL